jgi:hypothetical protein
MRDVVQEGVGAEDALDAGQLPAGRVLGAVEVVSTLQCHLLGDSSARRGGCWRIAASSEIVVGSSLVSDSL